MTRDYLNAGYSGDRLLVDLGLSILKQDNGRFLLHTLRTVFDEWQHCEGTPPAISFSSVSPGGQRTPAGRSTASPPPRPRSASHASETAVDLYE